MEGICLTWQRTASDPIIAAGPADGVVPAGGAPLAARAAMISRLLPSEDVVIVGRTAAWIWGLDVLPPGADEADWDVELVVPAPRDGPSGPSAVLSGASRAAAGFTARPCDAVKVPAEHVVEEGGVRITSLTRTALDCARWLPRDDAVAALDQFLRRGVEPGELTAMARGLPGYRGNRRLREIIRLGDPGAASPAESRVRVTLVRAGFPRPDTQVPVTGPRGRLLYVDLGYPDLRVGIEYDGERHHSGRAARAHDARRRRWLARERDWEIIPVIRSFLYRPAPYLEALLTAMLHRGWRPDDVTMGRLAARIASVRRRR